MKSNIEAGTSGTKKEEETVLQIIYILLDVVGVAGTGVYFAALVK